MISQLYGTISHTELRFVILDVHGVGYKVNIGADTLEKVTKHGESPIRLWTYLAVRETALDLYGFLTQEDLGFFELLITISGIGPKTAMGILSSASIAALRSAIISGDASHLTKVGGIGKKNAEKIVMELKDKIGDIAVTADGATDQSHTDESDALEALLMLGYSQKEARDALKKVSKDAKTTSERVKYALKMLGTH